VLYAQGSIRAVAYRKGRVWAEKTVETTGRPSRLVAEPATPRIPADGSEFGIVTVKVVDDKGRVVPNACVPVKIEVSGVGSFHAADNGDGADMTWYRRPERNTFNGCLSVLVKPAPGKAGKVKAVVRSEGLGTAVAEILCDGQTRSGLSVYDVAE
jgi:beta-galactosidase